MSALHADAASTSSSSSASTSICNNGTFVTVLSNQRYAAPAMCLRRQLQIVGSECPFLLIYNDADKQIPLQSLESAFGRDGLLPLSSLKARYRDHFAKPSSAGNGGSSNHNGGPSFLLAWQRQAWGHNATSDDATSDASDTSSSGRRLFQHETGVGNTHQKLWLWALPVQRAVFLDIDMLVRSNVDSLLSMELPSGGPGGGPKVGAVTCKSRYGNRFFNTGLLVFEPSLLVLKHLLEVERWANYPWNGYMPHPSEKWPDICAPVDDPYAARRLFPNASNPMGACRGTYKGRQPVRMSKACEQKYTDQSIFNFAFGSHVLVPAMYNDATRFNLNGSFIIHFVGEPKPWDSTRKAAIPGWHNASLAYRSACAKEHGHGLHHRNASHGLHHHNATRHLLKGRVTTR